MTKRSLFQTIFLSMIFVCLTGVTAFAQTQATAFTYQGRLNTSGSPASGTYEMQFQLFDSAKAGKPIGPTVTDLGVVVANGVFTTTLDFGESFDGSPRYLEIGVRPAKDPDPFTVLSPRNAINSVPYSVRSLAAAASDTLSKVCVDCVTSAQVQNLDGAKITGEIPTESIPSGSGNYIQNSVAKARAGRPRVIQEGSFDITGDGSIGGSLVVNNAFSLSAAAPQPVAPAGQGRIYFDAASNKVKVSENNGDFVDLVGASGISGSGVTNTVPLWTAGTTLDNSLISQTGGTIQLPASVSLAATASGNNITFGSPNSGTGLTISGPTTRADVRLDSGTLRLAVGQAGVGPPGNGIGIDATTVTLPSSVSLAATASGNNVGFGSPNSGTGMTISGPSVRADVRLDTTVLRLAVGAAGVGPPGNGVAITASGVGIGTTTPGTALHVVGTTRSSVIEITGGSDLAEKFEFSEEVKPGMVVAIDPRSAGKLRVARGIYNRQVAGIISGANNLAAGMTLPDVKNSANVSPVALSGRVWVYCDAHRKAIRPGDLLTTSATPGHAMRVLNHSKARGAIIGKAMTGLRSGRGLVLVLVTLQ